MADYDTFKDILDDLLSRGGDLTESLAEMPAEGKRYVLRAYWGLLRMFPWLWSIGYPPLQFVLPKKLSVTLSVTEDGTSVTGITPTVVDVAGYHMVVEVDGVAVRVASGSGATVTLQTGYYGTTKAAVAGYFFRNEIDVGDDVLLPVTLKDVSRDGKAVDIIGVQELESLVALTKSGDPAAAAFIDDRRLRFAPWSDVKRLMELSFVKRPAKPDFSGSAATDTPIVPIDERWLIADYALYFFLKDQDDDKAESVATVVAGRVQELREFQVAKMGNRLWVPEHLRIGVR